MATIIKKFKEKDKYNKNRKMVEFECDHCGKKHSYLERHFNMKSNHFCSALCANKSRSEGVKNTKCAYCKKEIVVNNSRVKRSKSGLSFCSTGCKNSAAKLEGGIKEIHPYFYGNAKVDYRNKAFRLKDQECERCGYNKYPVILEVHHKDKNRKNNDISNLEILCPNCHTIEHKIGVNTQNRTVA